ncbi:MAG: cyclase family protein [Pseudonocardiaceae bacterium]
MCSPQTVLAALDGAPPDDDPLCGHPAPAAQAAPTTVPVTSETVAPRTNRRHALRAALGAALGVAGTVTLAGTASAAPTATDLRNHLSYRRITDLTHTLSPDFPVFEFFVRRPEVQQVRFLDQHGFNTAEWRFNEHTGTHIDVPAHAQNGHLTVDELPVENFVAPLCVMRIAERVERDFTTELTVTDIREWERRNGRIPRRAFIASDAGWYHRVNVPNAFLNLDTAAGTLSFPGISPEAADFLLTQRDIVGFGTDTISLDVSTRLFPLVHRMLLTTGRYGLECLANLDQVPDRGATMVVGAPKLRGGFGAPVRVLALF